jgi:dihydroflavonol-4-reductase
MKAVVLGGTGFIGSHVVEQLLAAGLEVKAAVRTTGNSEFLEEKGAEVVHVNFTESHSLIELMTGSDIVYNCTAHPKMHEKRERLEQVELGLTRTLIQAAAQAGVGRFIQLSTIVVYDFENPGPINEKYPTCPKYTFQQVCLERERVVQEEGRRLGIETYILRPASTIGQRDKASFFSSFYRAHVKNKYPMIGSGEVPISLIDTRDIGRAMVWLGDMQYKLDDDGIYLAKGFDTTWIELKQHLDQSLNRTSKMQQIPVGLANMLAPFLEKVTPYSGEPILTPLLVKSLTVPRIWDDSKIRNTGFEPIYSMDDAVCNALEYLKA